MGLADIEEIGPVFARKLAKAGIRGTSGLITKGATPKGRKEIAAKSGIGGKLILEWVNLADLYRIKGVGSEYSDLLEEAGVDTVVELAKRHAKKLYEKMLAVNMKATDKPVVDRVWFPSLWVDEIPWSGEGLVRLHMDNIPVRKSSKSNQSVPALRSMSCASGATCYPAVLRSN